MAAAATFLLPAQIKQHSSFDLKRRVFHVGKRHTCTKNHRRFMIPVARLFGPAIFEASKLKVLFVGGGDEERKNTGRLPRAYTLTHSDMTSKLTLAISNTINQAQLQGWYNRLQRDEVVAEWKKVKGKMSLHVHCHISGGHFLLDFIASLRFYIFCKELPVVLKAFMIGDKELFNDYPELEEAPVYVYFHSNLQEFSRVECWGPLIDAATTGGPAKKIVGNSMDDISDLEWPKLCQTDCDCCFPPRSLIPWPHDIQDDTRRQSAEQLQQN